MQFLGPWADFARIDGILPGMIEEYGEEIQDDTIITKTNDTNQAPTAAKFRTVADFVSTGVSTDLAGGLLVDSDEEVATSEDLGGSWLTLAFFFFFSRAT